MDGRSLVKEVIDMPNEHLPEQNHLLAAFTAGTQDRLYSHLSPDPDGLLVVGKILNLRSSKLKGIVTAMKTVRVGLLNVNLVVVLLWDIRVYGYRRQAITGCAGHCRSSNSKKKAEACMYIVSTRSLALN